MMVGVVMNRDAFSRTSRCYGMWGPRSRRTGSRVQEYLAWPD